MGIIIIIIIIIITINIIIFISIIILSLLFLTSNLLSDYVTLLAPVITYSSWVKVDYKL